MVAGIERYKRGPMLPLPPAQIQETPAPREVGFPGFNQHPLKGTVLAGQGSGYFAVLVADSGALDRDWASPRLPGSHGGRALALWLREQGLGSLRFDKRMFGSRDSHLDTSLDAQVGDLKAALAAARALPEARGRKFLLVGHGEGALLALVASMEADALLLLAMPGQTMAKTLTEQLKPQLPVEKAGPNLAYLGAVFQAIRDDRPTPKAGPEVYPALARLGLSLMAPETLAFVKATLDLDPWAMASRVAAPVAVAWGGKDVQAWRSETLPAGFRGAVLTLPEANHLLKREPRPRAELNGANALEGYGDDRPLADLSPLAEWLKGLR